MQDRLSPFSAFKGKVDSFSVRPYPQPPEQGSSRAASLREAESLRRGCGGVASGRPGGPLPTQRGETSYG